MNVSYVVREVYVGFNEGLCCLTRDMTGKQDDALRLTSSQMAHPSNELIDDRTRDVRSFHFDGQLELAMSGCDLKLSVVSRFEAFDPKRIPETSHERQTSKAVQGLRFSMRFTSHSSTILPFPRILDNTNMWTT